MAINMQLSGSIINVKAQYQSFLDVLSTWWQFSNLMFTIFALFLLGYNNKKFYEKYPNWKYFPKS